MNALRFHRRLLVTLAILCLSALAGVASARDVESPGFLGVMLQDISPSMAKALSLDEDSGVLVSDVVDDSPAAEAGLTAGDVILKFDDEAIDGASDLTAAVRKTEPGDKVKLLVLRDGKQEKIKVEIGERDSDQQVKELRALDGDYPDLKFWKQHDVSPSALREMMGMVEEDRGFLGVGLADLTEQLGDYFGLKDGTGVLVTEVHQDSPAAKAGLKAGDIITKIDDEDTPSSEDLMEVMDETEPDQTINLRIIRQGKDKSFKVTLAAMPEGMAPPMMKGMFFGDDRDAMAPRCKWHQRRSADDQDEEIIYRHPDKGAPQVRILKKEFDDQEIDQLHQELDKLKAELDHLKQEFEGRK